MSGSRAEQVAWRVAAIWVTFTFVLIAWLQYSGSMTSVTPLYKSLPVRGVSTTRDVTVMAGSLHHVTANVVTNVKMPCHEIYVMSAILRHAQPRVTSSTLDHVTLARLVLTGWKEVGVSDGAVFSCCVPLNHSHVQHSVARQTNVHRAQDTRMVYVEFTCPVLSAPPPTTLYLHEAGKGPRCQAHLSAPIHVEHVQDSASRDSPTAGREDQDSTDRWRDKALGVTRGSGGMHGDVTHSSVTEGDASGCGDVTQDDVTRRGDVTQGHESGWDDVVQGDVSGWDDVVQGDWTGGGEVTLAVCVPVMYGEVSARELVEWLEFQRLVGVTRVHVNHNRLHQPALAVLRHYQQQGLVTLRPFQLVTQSGEKTLDYVDRFWTTQAFSDLYVIFNDCRQRLASFSFVINMDFDELFVPQPPFSTLTDVMTSLSAAHPDAAYFDADSYLHVRDWGPSYFGTPLVFLQHANRTRHNDMDTLGTLFHSSPKTLYRPQRVLTAFNHRHRVRPPYKRYPLPASHVLLHHYRSCKTFKWGARCWQWERVPAEDVFKFQAVWEQAVRKTWADLHLH